MVGYMPMPANFQYADVLRRGQPQHERFDRFRLRHPSMDTGKRAKIFAPFDALKGFNDAISAKEVQYEFRRELDDDEKEELNRRLGVLKTLTYNGKAARKNKVEVAVTYFQPCEDINSEAYGHRGQYVTDSGICWRISQRTLLLNKEYISLNEIVAIENTDGLFDAVWGLNS